MVSRSHTHPSNFSPINILSIFRYPRPPHNPVCVRRLDHSVSSFSLSLQRHQYLFILFDSLFISYNKHTFPGPLRISPFFIPRIKNWDVFFSRCISNNNFSVNVLAESQKHYAKYFSQERKPDVIDGNKWHIEDMIYAVLQNAKVVFNCELSSVIESYSANVFVGKVLNIKNSAGTSPLIYSSRKFTGIRD